MLNSVYELVVILLFYLQTSNVYVILSFMSY